MGFCITVKRCKDMEQLIVKNNGMVKAIGAEVESRCDPYQSITDGFAALGNCFRCFWTTTSSLCNISKVTGAYKDTQSYIKTGKVYRDLSDSIPAEAAIVDGYGDFILFRTVNGKRENIDLDTYQVALEIFKECHPANLDTNIADRRAHIVRSLSDYDVEVCFVPRTLYELTYVKELLSRDCQDYANDPSYYKNFNEDELSNAAAKIDFCFVDGVWNGSYLTGTSNAGIKLTNEQFDEWTKDRILHIGHRVNEVFCELLDREGIEGEVLTYGQIKELVAKQSEAILKSPLESYTYHVRSNIQNGVFSNAIALECSVDSIGKVILVRGGNLKADPVCLKGECVSLSFGTSFLAGVVNDRGATVSAYMDRTGYALVLDYKETSQLFYVPMLSTIASLLGKGEFFHARSNAWIMDEDRKVLGMAGASVRLMKDIPQLKSNLQQADFIRSFNEVRQKAVLLKI